MCQILKSGKLNKQCKNTVYQHYKCHICRTYKNDLNTGQENESKSILGKNNKKKHQNTSEGEVKLITDQTDIQTITNSKNFKQLCIDKKIKFPGSVKVLNTCDSI